MSVDVGLIGRIVSVLIRAIIGALFCHVLVDGRGLMLVGDVGMLIRCLGLMVLSGVLSGVVFGIEEFVGQLALGVLGVLDQLRLGFLGLFRNLGFVGINCRLGALVGLRDALGVLNAGVHVRAVVRLGFGLLIAQLRLVVRGFHGLVGRLLVGGLVGGGLEGGRGLLVHRVGEDLAQVRGDLRRGARRRGLGVLLVRGLGTLRRRRGDLGLYGRAFLEGSRLLGCGGQLGRCRGGHEELRGVAVQARADCVHIQEEAAIGHLAQVHEVHLDAGGRQHGQGGAHGGVDVACDHDQAGARANGRGHRVAELRPPGTEALGTRRILGGEIRPGD